MVKSYSVEYIVQRRTFWNSWKDITGYDTEDADRARDVFKACQEENPNKFRFIWRTVTDSDSDNFIIVREGEMTGGRK